MRRGRHDKRWNDTTSVMLKAVCISGKVAREMTVDHVQWGCWL